MIGRGAAVAAAASTLALLWPAAAGAIPDSGPRETVDIWANTTQTNASAALGYSGRYHAAGNPDADPPPLRHLVIELPPGTKIDTTVPVRCTATDSQLRFQGESACPAAARVGSGEVVVRQAGLGVMTYRTVLYNAPDDILELVMSGSRVVGVVHTYVRGTTLDGPVPTCLMGGQPPKDCPSDQLTILANRLQVDPVSVGEGDARRNYGTTPPTCPASGRWPIPVTFHFADGSVDTVTPTAPCTRPATATTKSTRRCRHRRTRKARRCHRRARRKAATRRSDRRHRRSGQRARRR